MKQKITIKVKSGKSPSIQSFLRRRFFKNTTSEPVQHSFVERLIFFLVLLITVFGITAIIFAWSNPTVAPPGGNLSGFLNTGSVAQTKSGALTIATSTYLATTGGNVGIGMTSPTLGKLSVNGVIHGYGGNGGVGEINLDNGASTSRFQIRNETGGWALKSVDASDVQIFTDNILGRGLTIKQTTGNVGIGTTGPRAKLDFGSSGGSVFVLNPGAAAAPNYTGFVHNDLIMGSYLSGGYPQGFISTGYTADVNRKFHIGSANSGTFDGSTTFVPALTVTSGGNVGIGTTGPSSTAKLHVVGDIIGNAQVFRGYMSSSFSHPSGWVKLPFNATVFNTLQGTFDTNNNRFTASRAGYYQISVTGYSSTPGTGSERYTIGPYKNGALEGFTGGNYSAGDTPLAGYTGIVYLNGSTDYVEIWTFSAITATWLGGSSGGHVMFWYMNYLGT